MCDVREDSMSWTFVRMYTRRTTCIHGRMHNRTSRDACMPHMHGPSVLAVGSLFFKSSCYGRPTVGGGEGVKTIENKAHWPRRLASLLTTTSALAQLFHLCIIQGNPSLAFVVFIGWKVQSRL